MDILIIEDECFAADKLEQLLKEIDPSIKIVGKLGTIERSVQWLLQNTADLIFLDIELSDGISFNIFEQVTISIPVVCVTAYDQYAINAFKLNCISYLLKPISKSGLTSCLQKYRILKSTYGIDFGKFLDTNKEKEPDYKKRFLIQTGDSIKKVEVSEIAYFYVQDQVAYLKTFQDHSYPVDFTLDKLEKLLHPDLFFRINRKYIVSVESISNMVVYPRARVKLELKPVVDNEVDTIVSIDRSTDFRKWLNN